MKILQIISGREINGVLVYCKHLCEILRDRGHQITTVCRSDSWIKSQFDQIGIPVIESDMARFPPADLRRIASFVNHHKFDVIHTHMSRAHSFGVLLKLYSRIPVVATAHSCSYQLHWPFNDFVIANSRATAEFQMCINKVRPEHIKLIHCFTPIERFKKVPDRSIQFVRRQLRLRGDEFVVSVVGNVVPRKGLIYLFRALGQIVDEVPTLKVLILGRFHRDERYTCRLREIQIADQVFCHVKWLGIRENIPHFLAASDLCVIPSLKEPLGLVAVESMAAGTPVVASRVGGLPEIVAHEENGLLVPPANVDALAAAIVRLARDEALRKQCGERGRKMVFEKFDPANLTTDVENIYRSLITKRSMAA